MVKRATEYRRFTVCPCHVRLTSKFLLPGGVPHVEANGATARVELQRMNLDSKSRDVLLLELSGHMPKIVRIEMCN